MDGPLKLMEFDDAPPLSFVEAPDMGKLLDDPATVARHTLMFNLLVTPRPHDRSAQWQTAGGRGRWDAEM
ncbi:Scr1 family TA system antitoxin-like transcriptional regulator [Streptomyces sp. NBC_00286]|uniref:Scr1 family TA system antitoxin-like transcriptional regulator n=1 Tax=Streptomyces sp. NBC_00286 TaxID=2975701 RepID=UPI002E27ED34|nr:Scr1 family TA system antitoxin-like transcriptional regulator [Streptomyces sp. NBC_00286]